MNELEKALQWVTEFLNYEEMNRATYEDTCGTGDLTEEERIELYKSMDDQINMFKVIKSALEKQIPKKPLNMSKQIDRQHDAKQNIGECPNCKNNIVAYAWFKNTHCWLCGQAIDWSVEE